MTDFLKILTIFTLLYLITIFCVLTFSPLINRNTYTPGESVVVDLENELELGGVIVGLALEGVGRSLEQVYVSTGEVVDQVQIGRRCLLKSPVPSC